MSSMRTSVIALYRRRRFYRNNPYLIDSPGATLDAGVFENFFKSNGKVGRIEISGRTFPVEDYYLDDVIRMTGFNAGRGGKREEFDDESVADTDSDVTTAIQSIGVGIN